MSSFRPRARKTLPKISNRERMRRADRAVAQVAAAEMLVKLLLAQAGGEVTIAKGTASQIPDDSTIELVPSLDEKGPTGECVIRLLLGQVDADTGAISSIEQPALAQEVTNDPVS